MTNTTQPISLKHRLDLFFGLSLYLITTLFAIRLVADAGLRMNYPFIPQISAGIGLSVVGFSWLIFARALVGITAPFFGPIADRIGQRRMMALGLLAESLGLGGMLIARQWWAAIPFILFGLGMTAYLPAHQAYLSNQVSYAKRGRAMASVETSFAVTGVLTLPIFGWLIDGYGWQAPFMILSVLSFLAAIVIWFRLPASPADNPATAKPTVSWEIIARPNVLAVPAVGFFALLATGCLFTIWGIWLSADYGFTASDLGLVATGIGIAELIGAAISALFIDRIGKKPGAQGGLLLSAIVFASLPFMQFNLWGILLALIILSGCLEYTLVSFFPLYSVQAPEARATVFSLATFGTSIGLAISAPITTLLWENFGVGAVATVATIALFIALFLVTKYLVAHEETS